MSLISATQSPLIDALPGGRNLAVKVAIAIAGSALLAISAKVQVPFYPVPVTMQTLVVLVLGMTLGSRLGFATLALYLAEGLAGLPVFAGTPEKGIGLAYMMGPTGGYLIGYLLAATLTGWLAERGFDRSLRSVALALVLGNVAIYLPGVLWLGAVIGWDKPVLAYGLTPFLAGDALKLALGACLLPLLRNAAPGSKR
ncbi:MAG: biotin transporter BioY [Stutzerimonas stutzeri]|nr:MAG: biotin transporter BioY [Stutzerimonas stutzeri]